MYVEYCANGMSNLTKNCDVTGNWVKKNNRKEWPEDFEPISKAKQRKPR